MLVVLDDAASTAQVNEVLPGSERSCVLVTTRKTLRLNAVSVPIEPFGSEHAEALAGRDLGEPVSDEDRAALRKVANACGGHPLALDLLRGKLAGRAPLSSYVDGILSRGLLPRLRFDDGAELSEVAFKAVHEELSAAQERAFRLLGAHPGATFSAHGRCDARPAGVRDHRAARRAGTPAVAEQDGRALPVPRAHQALRR